MLDSLAIAKMLLEIQLPNLEDCWDEGRVLSATHKLEDNPYKPGTANFHHWQEGWWYGQLNELGSEGYTEQAANDEILSGRLDMLEAN